MTKCCLRRQKTLVETKKRKIVNMRCFLVKSSSFFYNLSLLTVKGRVEPETDIAEYPAGRISGKIF